MYSITRRKVYHLARLLPESTIFARFGVLFAGFVSVALGIEINSNDENERASANFYKKALKELFLRSYRSV